MRIRLRADTNQYDTSRIQFEPVRTDMTWHGPVRFNRDELIRVLSPVLFTRRMNIIFNKFWCRVYKYYNIIIQIIHNEG